MSSIPDQRGGPFTSFMPNGSRFVVSNHTSAPPIRLSCPDPTQCVEAGSRRWAMLFACFSKHTPKLTLAGAPLKFALYKGQSVESQEKINTAKNMISEEKNEKTGEIIRNGGTKRTRKEIPCQNKHHLRPECASHNTVPCQRGGPYPPHLHRHLHVSFGTELCRWKGSSV